MNSTLLQRHLTPLVGGLHQGAGNPPPLAMNLAVHAARYKALHAPVRHGAEGIVNLTVVLHVKRGYWASTAW